MYAAIGDLDGAYEHAERNLAARDRFMDTVFLFYPEMREFRRDPRFWPLVARMGLADYWLTTDEWPDFCAEPNLSYECKPAAKAAVKVIASPSRE
jgi:hypothetical protein